MSVRTYNHSVLIGNWNEDICLNEDKLKDFLDKKDKGELLIQKASNFLGNILKKVDLSISFDGFLHFGDMVCLYNPASEALLSANMSESKMHEAKSLVGPCEVSASKLLQPCARNVFVITSPSDSPQHKGEVLHYGQPFSLSTLPGIGGQLNLFSDIASFSKSARKSRKQEVLLTEQMHFLSSWKCLCYDPKVRLESDGMPVVANQRLIINHCKTNQNLACLTDFSFRTPFGREFEIVSHTMMNSHRAETPPNHWVIMTGNMEDASREHELEDERMLKASSTLETFNEEPQGGAFPLAEPPENPVPVSGV